MKTTTRALAVAVTLGVPFLVGAGVASAAPGHTGCRVLGATTASEAHDGILVPEILFFAPGSVDDVIALVQVGGTFDGETVEPLCQSK